MEIPKDVIDKVAYLKYKSLSKHPILNNDKLHICSDGTEVNLAAFPNVIKKWIMHLPPTEQSHILTLKDDYYKVNNQLTVYKRNAYGMRQGYQKGDKGKQSITSYKKTELIELFGRMFTTEEVVKLVHEEWAVPIKKEALHKFRVTYAEEIKNAQEKFKASHVDVRLGVKRSRLDEYTYLYARQKEKYTLNPTDNAYKLMLQTLEQIRKEVEGDRLTVEGKVDVNYEVNLQEHLRAEVFSTINLKEIILARVAAKMGVNPVKLIWSLNASYYKQFSNVLGDFDPTEGKETIYPSQLSYDFERIGKNQAVWDRLAEDAVIEERNLFEKKDEAQAMTIKDILLEKLRAKKKNLGSEITAMNAMASGNQNRK